MRSPLAPFRSLRVGDYRIIYWVYQNEVRILALGHRRVIYDIVRTREDD
jgi:mRNA-degrading endonuclease RelE of RelBE toxin-antitoxin system